MSDDKIVKYKIRSTRFLSGYDGSYTYTIVFNRSLVHTLRFEGIEKGLDMYERYENSWGLKKWLIKKLMGFKY